MMSFFNKEKYRWMVGTGFILVASLVTGGWAVFQYAASPEGDTQDSQSASGGDGSNNIVGNQGDIRISQHSYSDRGQTILRDRGIAAYNDGEHDRAFELLKESAKLNHRDGLHQEEAMDYLQIGIFMIATFDKELYDDVKGYLEQADSLAELHGFKSDPDFAVLRNNLAETYNTALKVLPNGAN